MREKVGAQHAAWLHLGRNRGESLRAYLPRLYFRHVLYEQRRTVAGMLRVLVEKAEPVLEAVAPNYHHLQHSGFGTLGEYLLSWVPVFLPHLERLEQVEQRLDYGPSVIGARKEVHALYDKVSRRLGFSRRAWLRRDGIWVHSQFTEPFFALSLVAVDIARMAQDMRIWMTPEFGFFVPADEHSGGSSALPHAKVPFGFQAVIGGAILAANRLAGEMSAAAGGPSEGSEPIYHSGSLYEAAADIVARTGYMAEVIEHGRFDLEELKRKSTTDYAGSSEAHDRLVYDYGVPFRTGHRLLGAMAPGALSGRGADRPQAGAVGGDRPRYRRGPGRDHGHRAGPPAVAHHVRLRRAEGVVDGVWQRGRRGRGKAGTARSGGADAGGAARRSAGVACAAG